jgi:hypothetical protein
MLVPSAERRHPQKTCQPDHDQPNQQVRHLRQSYQGRSLPSQRSTSHLTVHKVHPGDSKLDIPVRSRPESQRVNRCRFVCGTSGVNSPIQNPAYRRSRPTFCMPKAASCGPQIAV